MYERIKREENRASQTNASLKTALTRKRSGINVSFKTT
jgi:hypothetical protein